eukprot:6195848-Pleurochrysis_carterae.AAC.4
MNVFRGDFQATRVYKLLHSLLSVPNHRKRTRSPARRRRSARSWLRCLSYSARGVLVVRRKCIPHCAEISSSCLTPNQPMRGDVF